MNRTPAPPPRFMPPRMRMIGTRLKSSGYVASSIRLRYGQRRALEIAKAHEPEDPPFFAEVISYCHYDACAFHTGAACTCGAEGDATIPHEHTIAARCAQFPGLAKAIADWGKVGQHYHEATPARLASQEAERRAFYANLKDPVPGCGERFDCACADSYSHPFGAMCIRCGFDGFNTIETSGEGLGIIFIDEFKDNERWFCYYDGTEKRAPVQDGIWHTKHAEYKQ